MIPGNPNTGGNGRKQIHRALEGSLRRLQTDYIDLYWMHVWDLVTPVEEVLQTLGDLVRAGKIRYFGFSDIPAWYAVKAATLATAHHLPSPLAEPPRCGIAMQLAYSLVERNIEREHLPAARECGLGICPWSPLAAGFLTGKYRREEAGASGEGRLIGSNPLGIRCLPIEIGGFWIPCERWRRKSSDHYHRLPLPGFLHSLALPHRSWESVSWSNCTITSPHWTSA